ncbi:AraC family transcriptional regulator [Paenibacillus sp. MBLB4367]|uniref:AraC family transcriptional regulator n=1 Tax=Paenibacillus sp. MBLB4367 TaxID=3384767 RepID=UPI0039082BE3
MKTNRSNANRTYAKFLLSLVVSIVVTLFTVSIILYFNFVKVALSNIYDSEKNSLSQTSSGVKFMNDSAHTLALQIYTDGDLTATLDNPLRNPPQLSEAAAKLNMYRYISPFMHSIYVYSDTTEAFYISSPAIHDVVQGKSSFEDREALSLIESYRSYKTFSPIPRLIPDTAGGDGTKSASVYTYMFHDIPSGSSKLGRIVMLNISEAFIRDTIQSLEAGAPSDTSIVDSDGRLISSNLKEPMLTDVSERSYVQQIRRSAVPSGYFVDQVNGVKSLIIYASYKPLDWTFIRTIPYARIIAKIDHMRQITLLLGLAILIVGLLASYVLSRRLFKPIDKALASLKTLEAEKRDRFYHEKQEALRDLLRGRLVKTGDPSLLFAKYRMELQKDKAFVLLLLRIDRYSEFCSAYNAVDRSLLRFSVKNIAAELLDGHFLRDAVDMENDQIALLLNVEEGDRKDVDHALHGLILRIQEAAQAYLKLSISAVISARFRWDDGIGDVYGEAEQASMHRLIRGHGCIIDVESMGEDASDRYLYPFHKEQAFSEALLSGRIDDAKQKYGDMVNDAVVTNDHTTVQLTLTHLAFAGGRCLDLMKKNGSQLPDASSASFVQAFNQLETLEQINGHFHTLFDRIASKPEEKKKSRYDELTVQVTALIRSQYMEPGLSLDSVADAVGMSPAYLGRLFKKLTGKSIPDYIMEVRNQQAKEMLARTDAPINDIAERVGFTNSTYFFKVFKKTNGVTPNEYRQSMVGG